MLAKTLIYCINNYACQIFQKYIFEKNENIVKYSIHQIHRNKIIKHQQQNDSTKIKYACHRPSRKTEFKFHFVERKKNDNFLYSKSNATNLNRNHIIIKYRFIKTYEMHFFFYLQKTNVSTTNILK